MADLYDLTGRRFEFADGSAPDVTLVAVDPQAQTVCLHAADGTKQTLPLGLFLDAYREGVLAESWRPGFVNDDVLRAAQPEAMKHVDSVGVAGRGKRIISHAQMLRGR